ncbi:MAG: sulfatase/phosphatase domain-containing protein, partial [Planctomycetota bacterium]|nr:sulfatase/phosphatase domain-containing protein [Planctomycetota bacterium]
LRSGKGWLYEGGIREPMIVRVPGVGKPGSTCQQPVVSMDFFPTMLELAGLDLDENLHADGESLLPLLKGQRGLKASRDFYWHYPHYHGSSWKPGAAIRSRNMKLIEFYHENDVELYDLAADPAETKDLSRAQPQIVKELRNKLSGWQQEMNAKMPRPK